MTAPFPVPLSDYPPPVAEGLLATLAARIEIEPFNLIATGIFLLAIVHTFAAARFTILAHALQLRHQARAAAAGTPAHPSVAAELLHFMGEVEVVFGLWAIVLVALIVTRFGWATAAHYVNDTVTYTEPLFVVVIMALAATRPIVVLAENGLGTIARLGGHTPAAWWLTILTLAPLLGSFITEPAAMTIGALLLGRQFYDLNPGSALKYATLGLLFVNVSIGGTLTHFAAPPVLMVARHWEWGTFLTSFNDNALITYLATLVPNLDDRLKAAVVEGAVTGGGLTVIANAPNPAGQALLSRFFSGAVAPLYLLAGALMPTLIAVLAFRLF